MTVNEEQLYTELQQVSEGLFVRAAKRCVRCVHSLLSVRMCVHVSEWMIAYLPMRVCTQACICTQVCTNGYACVYAYAYVLRGSVCYCFQAFTIFLFDHRVLKCQQRH